MVDLEDVSEAATTVLTEPEHEGATYELSGPDVLNQKEVAAILEEQLNRKVSVQEIGIEMWKSEQKAVVWATTKLTPCRRCFAIMSNMIF